MIRVKLYGLLRLDSGIKEKQLDAGSVKEVLRALEACGISKKNLNGSIILINGAAASKHSKLKDGDVVQLLSPVAGG